MAQQLTRAGHTVAVYERADKIGGLLRYGIPEFKMEKAVLDRRLAQMEAEGTRFRRGVDVGVEITGQQLRDRYDAVVLAVGATVPRDLPVPGRELDGILQAMDFLPPANRVALGEQVEGQVTRQGQGRRHHRRRRHRRRLPGHGAPPGRRARSPSWRSCRARPRSAPTQPWPTYPMIYRVSSAHEEGGERVYAVNTQEFLGDERGHGSGRCGWSRSSRRRPVRAGRGQRARDPGPAGAAGHGLPGPEPAGLVEQLGVELDERGNIRGTSTS